MGSCCGNMAPKTKSAELIFKRAELLYDAENYAFVEGDILPEDSEHVRHQVTDIGQSGNIDRVTRMLNLVHSECVEMLYPYTKEVISEDYGPLNDVLTVPEEYIIVLFLPDTFSFSTLRLLEHLIHEYIVYRVLADWMSITKPDSSPKWSEKALEAKAEINRVKNNRTKILRRKSHPF